jgi:uncharacterized protein
MPANSLRTPNAMTDCRSTPGLDVRDSHVHGSGVFALRTFAAGDPIASYEGRRIAQEACGGDRWDHRLTYLFGLSDGSMIDGAVGGNATRHINHSCAPNCIAYEVEDGDGPLRVEIEAVTEIAVGDELFLDYQLDAEADDPSEFACRCGTAACRGTMLAAQPE